MSGADKLHNARAIVSDLLTIGPAVFDRFSAPRAKTLWYYGELSRVFCARRAPMAGALAAEVERMEDLATAG